MIVADISISLDGFVTGPDPGPEHGLGRGVEAPALHTWALDGDEVDRRVLAEMMDRTGAVVMGRRLFDIVDGPHGWTDEMGYGAGHAGSQPMFVVTHRPPATWRLGPRFTFVTDGLSSALEAARSAAGGRDVVIMGGGEIIGRAVADGLVDELHLHVAPIVLGGGTSLFRAGVPRRFTSSAVVATPAATHLVLRA